MDLWKRVFGICKTKPPEDAGCWRVSDNVIEIDLERAQELSSVFGAIRLEGSGLPERVLVMHGYDGLIHAFKNKCTHGGRRIDPISGKSFIQCCSIGKSSFDFSGKVISGPAKGPLPVLQVKMEHDKMVIPLD